MASWPTSRKIKGVSQGRTDMRHLTELRVIARNNPVYLSPPADHLIILRLRDQS